MIFFTSDTHFGHEKIIQHCNRPWSNAEEMGEGLIERWNDVVGPKDEVWHLGDFSFRASEEYAQSVLDRLNGKIHLVLGNHDQVIPSGFESVQDYKYLKYNKQKIVLFHYPIRSWRARSHGSWHLFGHCHGSLITSDRSIDVGVDCWDWRPVSFEELAEVLK